MSKDFSLRHILKKHEEQLMDFSQNICLLCKRRFDNGDQIKRHRNMSKLHSSRLKRLRQRLFTEDQLEKLERKERESLYRDRAKERRLKFGLTDSIVTADQSYNSPLETAPKKSSTVSAKPLGPDNNKGAALLSKMGWKEGHGLGRCNEGITEIIKIDSQVGTSGLGSKSCKVDHNLSYKDAVKKIMHQRYHDKSSDEDAPVQ